jgi:hypothetical protein
MCYLTVSHGCDSPGGTGGGGTGVGSSAAASTDHDAQYGNPPLTFGLRASTHGAGPAGSGTGVKTPSSQKNTVPAAASAHGSQQPANADLFVLARFLVEFTDRWTFPFGVAPVSRFAFCFAIVLPFVPGCGPPAPTGPESVYSVGVYRLARDYPTAQSYAGALVRVRLAADSYTSSGSELRVSGDAPGSPPLVVFACRDPLGPGPAPAVEVVGRVLSPVRDRVFRTATADFSVRVVDCHVSPPR